MMIGGLSAASINLDDPNSVSPGILGFLAFFLLAIALYLLVRNMNGHLRRVRYRQEAVDAEEAAERAAAEARAAAMGAAEGPEGPAAPGEEPKPAP